MTKIWKVLGCAGAGKTTYLLNKLEEYLAKGVHPNEIGFISFTNKAVNEAATRALVKFPQFTKKDFLYFRTLHSLAFRAIGASAEQIVTSQILDVFGEYCGYSFNGSFSSTGFYSGLTEDDKILSAYIAGREKGLSASDAYEQSDLKVYKSFFLDMAYRYEVFKQKNGYIDFDDMISKAIESGVFPHFKLLILDEAQDFSPIQWKLVDKLMGNAEDVYLAGDDLQAIFSFKAADVDRFIKQPAEEIKLEQSHRVPKAIQRVAYRYAERHIVNKTNKVMKPRSASGEVKMCTDLEQVDFKAWRSYFILSRNAYHLADIAATLRMLGVPAVFNGTNNFSATFKAKVKDILDKGIRNPVFDSEDDWLFYNRVQEKGFLADVLKPRVVLSTIHGVKGGEAECVVLLTAMTKASKEELITSPDDYYRVLYTAITRAKRSLYILDNAKKYKYDFI